ncbi:MAG TPA: hypothetical protein PKD26_16825 [Pyrinomonadaceae bacterium]|nr:hypothetical protein [Pyrinomonadaceae bacterium]
MNLDVCFQIFVPKLRQIDGLIREQEVFTWDGTDYPQEPVIYKWGNHVELIPGDAQPFVLELFPKSFISPEWNFFAVEGDGLWLLEDEVNGDSLDWDDNRLDDFLNLFLNQHDQWAVVFELHCDQIDNVYQLTVEECVRKLKQNLDRNREKEGFIALSPPRG